MAYSDTLGLMTERVQLQAPPLAEAEQDKFGSPQGDWGTFATVPARVETTGAVEVVEADGLKAIGSYAVTVRMRGDVNEKCRVLWKGLALYVKSVQLPGGPRGRFMVLSCSAAKG